MLSAIMIFICFNKLFLIIWYTKWFCTYLSNHSLLLDYSVFIPNWRIPCFQPHRNPFCSFHITGDVKPKKHYYCQAQFQLASSVPVQLGNEISLNISVTPHPPTHPGKYIWAAFRLPLMLKFGMEALFNLTRSTM